jgi:anaerobic magnesium-protoporphyrin IX monomethyl ester cyclase
MKALLINPHKLIPVSFSLTQRASPPLGLAFIAAALESEGYDVQVVDCVAEAPTNYFSFGGLRDVRALGLDFDHLFRLLGDQYDIIGMTAMFSNNWLINRDLMNRLKERHPEALTVIGGEHATAIPEYCLTDCEGLDVVVAGEGEETIAEVARAVKQRRPLSETGGIAYRDRAAGRVVTMPRRPRIREIDAVPRPAWHLFPLEKYFDNEISYGIAYGRSLPIFATRGCPYVCTFCSSPQMWGVKYSMRDPSDVIDEIKFLNREYGVTNIDFYDLTAIIRKQWILEFCRLLKDNDLHITWQIPAGTRSESIDYEVAMALKDSGCKNITYAPESGSPDVLKAIKKKVKPARMLFSIGESHRAGLDIKLNIMVGYPDERVRDAFRTIWFLVRASWRGATDAAPSMFSAYPGSALFEELVKHGELKMDDRYFESIVFSQSLHKFRNYSRRNSRLTMIMVVLLAYLAFYVSNYVFRPLRAVRLIKNVVAKKYQTRGEYMIGEILRRKRAIRVA